MSAFGVHAGGFERDQRMSYRKIGREAVFEGLTRRLVHHGHRLRRRDFRARGRTHGLWPCLESLEQRTLLTTGVLVLPDTPSPPTFGATVNVTEFGNTLNTTSDFNTSGGNFLGTFNGNQLRATYCLNLTLGISPPEEFDSANETTDGTIYGIPVPNAGAISWLLTNIGPTVTTLDQEAALQAAIWRTEYGPSGFQVNSIDNSDTTDTTGEEAIMQPFYQSYLQALGNNTAPVSSVDWISPDEEGMDQGLVALPTITAAPLTLGNLSPTQWEVDEPGYDGTIAVSGGTGSYTNLNVTGLPTGLSASLESSTVKVNGVPMLSGTIFISGTPRESGTFTLGVTVDDGTEPVIGIAVSPIRSAGVTTDNSNNDVAVEDGAAVAAIMARTAQAPDITPDAEPNQTSKLYQLSVTNSPSLGDVSPLTTVTIKGKMQAQFTVPINGGTGPFKLTAITGVPKGMTAAISGNTLKITGKPALGTYNIRANVTDQNGVKLTAQFPITIDAMSIGNGDGVPQANTSAARLNSDTALSDAIDNAATPTVSAPTLRAIVSVESTANSKIGLKNPGYAGPFQVSVGAANQVGYKLSPGRRSLAKLNVLNTNVTVAAKYLQYCAAQLAKKNIPITPVNLYLAYQQGPGGLETLYKQVENGKAAKTPATKYKNELNNSGNLETYISPKSKITAQDFYDYWTGKIEAEDEIVNPPNP